MQITIRNLQKKIPIYPIRIKKTILNILSGEGIKTEGQITVCFVNDNKIRKINKQFMNKDYSTDVLAFDLSSGKGRPLLADIVISTDTALRNCRIYGTNPLDEVNLYVAHGLLHILGYNDHTKEQLKSMRNKEENYVNR